MDRDTVQIPLPMPFDLKRFAQSSPRYSAIGYCMIVSALCVQFSCAFRIIFDPENPHVKLENCMEGLFCAGAVMISYGAVSKDFVLQ